MSPFQKSLAQMLIEYTKSHQMHRHYNAVIDACIQSSQDIDAVISDLSTLLPSDVISQIRKYINQIITYHQKIKTNQFKASFASLSTLDILECREQRYITKQRHCVDKIAYLIQAQ